MRTNNIIEKREARTGKLKKKHLSKAKMSIYRKEGSYVLSRKEYVWFRQMSKDDVKDFLSGDQPLYSNKTTYKEEVERLLEYKDAKSYNYTANDTKRTYMNIYAYSMTVLLPSYLNESEFCNYVRKLMIQIDPRYRKLLYVYKFSKCKNANYVDLMMFTRKSSTKEHSVGLVYPDTYYQDSITKRRCKKDHPNAVLKHKKNDPILDSKGKQIVKKTYVDFKEARIFVYKSFKKFIDGIKKTISLVTSIFNQKRNFYSGLPTHYKYFSKVTIKKEYTVLKKRKIEIKNSMIERINQRLEEIQDALYLGKFIYYRDIEKSFNKMIWKINKYIYETNVKWEGISIYLGYRQSFLNFRDSHIDFENYLITLFDEWYEDNIYIPYMSQLKS